MWAGLTDLHIKIPMGITAENLAEKYQITREDCDNYTYQTQQRWKAGKIRVVFIDLPLLHVFIMLAVLFL